MLQNLESYGMLAFMVVKLSRMPLKVNYVDGRTSTLDDFTGATVLLLCSHCCWQAQQLRNHPSFVASVLLYNCVVIYNELHQKDGWTGEQVKRLANTHIKVLASLISKRSLWYSSKINILTFLYLFSVLNMLWYWWQWCTLNAVSDGNTNPGQWRLDMMGCWSW